MNNATIPATPTDAPTPPFGADMPPLQGSILLVEDESFVREVTAEILEAAGYQVLKARSAVEAIRQFRQHPGEVELLVVDVVLPGRNGCDMVRELRQDDPTLKTIFISGYPQSQTARNENMGKAAYLPKPFSVDSLMRKIRDVVIAG